MYLCNNFNILINLQSFGPMSLGTHTKIKNDKKLITGFSKLPKKEKINQVTQYFSDPEHAIQILKSFWHKDPGKQQIFDEFSENTLTNFYFPFGVCPNMIINGSNYIVPMVIEESSVVAAASSSTKFWSERGGFHAKVISKLKIGQVHFIWKGNFEKLNKHMPAIRKKLFEGTDHITINMVSRGGGIENIELVDCTHELDNYYQLLATFDTVDSMGANFINSCLEEFASILKLYLGENDDFTDEETEPQIIMSILSNYTPECLVEAYVETDINNLNIDDENFQPEEFAWKFDKAVKIAQADVYRATTHNKGIFNGIDAVILATGNDFRAVEACGHTFASRKGRYTSLTDLKLENGKFRYGLTFPMAIGTIGGLTALHPMAKFSLELLGNPSAEELMMIAVSAGLANNFAAIKSLITKGIQHGHMKMHLLNVLNHFGATQPEKQEAVDFFNDKKVSFARVAEYLANKRQ